MAHEFEQQRRDSYADQEWFCSRLIAAGYSSRRYEDDDTVEASIGIAVLNADTIWEHELATTQIALECGFYPDGWGFLSNNGVKS